MKSQIEQYISEEYLTIKTLKKTPRSVVILATDSNGLPVVVKKIRAVGLPYKKLQELNIPLLPQIFFVAEKDEFTYVVEEFVSGKNLGEELAAGITFDPDSARRIMLGLLEGMAKFHGAGIVHRDIKPSNIILQNADNVRLIDFDAARQLHEENAPDTERLGTMGYAPPEQYGFGQKQTDARSDIFALGVTIKEILKENCPQNFKKILDKCTALNPDDRYSSAEELRAAIIGNDKLKQRLLPAACAIAVFAVLFGLFRLGSYEPPAADISAEQKTAGQTTHETQEMPKETQPAEEKTEKETIAPPKENLPAQEEPPTDNNVPPPKDAANALPQVAPPKNQKVFSPTPKKKAETLAEGDYKAEILPGNYRWQGGNTILVPASVHANWHSKDKLTANIPDGWSVAVRFTNNSGATIRNLKLSYGHSGANAEESAGDVAAGSSVTLKVPLSGRHIRSDEHDAYAVGISISSD